MPHFRKNTLSTYNSHKKLQKILHCHAFGNPPKIRSTYFSGLVTTDDSIRKINPIEYQKKKQNH